MLLLILLLCFSSSSSCYSSSLLLLLLLLLFYSSYCMYYYYYLLLLLLLLLRLLLLLLQLLLLLLQLRLLLLLLRPRDLPSPVLSGRSWGIKNMKTTDTDSSPAGKSTTQTWKTEFRFISSVKFSVTCLTSEAPSQGKRTRSEVTAVTSHSDTFPCCSISSPSRWTIMLFSRTYK